VRSFEAFQLGTLILSPQTPGLEHKQVIDASMGCASHVSWERCAQAELLNGPLIAIETSPQSESLQDFVFPEKFTLILGNEEYGCREDSLAAADAIIEIPLVGRKNSLNVANAFAIVAWEISRQLREK
jgi:tRNA G18 (ribose-2'-O)-methylase SpoU